MFDAYCSDMDGNFLNIPRVASTRSLLSSCVLCNVLEKLQLEGECVPKQKHRG